MTLIADDSATDLQPGQLRKAEFLDRLEIAVCKEAEAALAGTDYSTDGCPYLAFWFGYYRSQSSQHVGRALHHYMRDARAARSAVEYVPLIAARVRRSVEHWVRTGEIVGVPEDAMPAAAQVQSAQGAPAGVGAVQLWSRDGASRRSDDPAALEAALGAGRPLESRVRSQMERVFGRSFSEVRLHTDAAASRLSHEQSARAFTVGAHVAFGAGEYRPGSPVGDALIAHELAHVVQQGAGTAPVSGEASDAGRYRALESDADETAAGVVASLYDRTRNGIGNVARSVVPSLKSGLRLQRCKKRTGDEAGAGRRCEVKSGPTYSPNGTITPTLSGGLKRASFAMAAEFKNEPAKGVHASCCEVRQYIQWSTGESPPNHAGFRPASSFAAETWYEDRDGADKRYGHRSGTYSDPGVGDQYLNAAGNQDQANGHIYAGSDAPGGSPSRTGEWRFELRVIDTCNSDSQTGGTDNVTIDF